jgi:hypothetical protein
MKNFILMPTALCLSLAGCGGGGGGGSDNGGMPPAPVNGGNNQGDQDSLYYRDVRDLKSQEPLKGGLWPSLTDPGKTLPACAEGQAFYRDECWDSTSIDLDSGSVKFSNAKGSLVIALGAEHDKSLAFWADPKYAREDIECRLPYNVDEQRGFVDFSTIRCAEPTNIPDAFSPTPEVWPGLSPVVTTSPNTPWALTPSVFVDRNSKAVTGFSVKTTFVYGYYADPDSTFKIAHNWHYRGNIILSGKSYPLPVTFETLKAQPNVLQNSDGSLAIELNDKLVMITNADEVELVRDHLGKGLNLSPTNQKYVTGIAFSAKIKNDRE